MDPNRTWIESGMIDCSFSNACRDSSRQPSRLFTIPRLYIASMQSASTPIASMYLCRTAVSDEANPTPTELCLPRLRRALSTAEYRRCSGSASSDQTDECAAKSHWNCQQHWRGVAQYSVHSLAVAQQQVCHSAVVTYSSLAFSSSCRSPFAWLATTWQFPLLTSARALYLQQPISYGQL